MRAALFSHAGVLENHAGIRNKAFATVATPPEL
jgi:hypothetical protein